MGSSFSAITRFRMTRVSLFFILLTLQQFIDFSSALSCQPCEKTKCRKPLKPSDCTSGETEEDICGCCPGTRCKKATGERCGGEWGMSGNCATGLTCEKALDEEFVRFGKCKSKV